MRSSAGPPCRWKRGALSRMLAMTLRNASIMITRSSGIIKHPIAQHFHGTDVTQRKKFSLRLSCHTRRRVTEWMTAGGDSRRTSDRPPPPATRRQALAYTQ